MLPHTEEDVLCNHRNKTLWSSIIPSSLSTCVAPPAIPSTSFIPASCFPITQACYLRALEAFSVSLPKYSIHKRLSPISNKTYSALRGHERAAGQFIMIYWKHYGIAQRPWSESSCAQSCSSLSAAVQSRKMDEVA